MSATGEGSDLDWASADWRRSTFCGEAACVEVAVVDGWVAVRDSKSPTSPQLVFSGDEWDSFLRGVSAGEFGCPGVVSEAAAVSVGGRTPSSPG